MPDRKSCPGLSSTIPRRALIPLAILFLSGCATIPPESGQPQSQTDPSLSLVLSHAAARIAREMAVVANVQAARHPVHVNPPPPMTGQLAMRASLNWNGPVRPALKALTAFMNWQFVERGAAPISPPLVSIHASDRKIFHILNAIGAQTGPGVTVLVNVDKRRITLDYQVLPSTNVGDY
ncbi:MAG: DotD/TraH family lipoprotein [Acidithiobacillus sp.]